MFWYLVDERIISIRKWHKKEQINLEKEFLIDFNRKFGYLLQLVEVDKRNTVDFEDKNWKKT